MCVKLDSGSLRSENRQSWGQSCSVYCSKTSRMTVALLPPGLPPDPGAGSTADHAGGFPKETLAGWSLVSRGQLNWSIFLKILRYVGYWVKHTSQDFYSAQERGPAEAVFPLSISE